MTRFPVADFRQMDTPFYYYDLDLLDLTLAQLLRAAAHPAIRVHYAVKANANPVILKQISRAGLGADVVSGGEIKAALNAGFKADDIVFAGVGKTDREIRLALQAGVGCFNVESLPELMVIDALAAEEGRKARVALRVNPDIDAHTHRYITTGLAENKFGIDMRLLDGILDTVATLDNIELAGLHFHIGSQITDLTPYILLCERINALQTQYESRGIHFPSINVGGGLGVDYANPARNPIPDFEAFFKIFSHHLQLRHNQTLHFELGRSITAQCGSLITRVIYVKEGISRRFAIVDAGMTDLIRPALYNAHHKIEKLNADPEERQLLYDVVGPICESSDCFGTDELLPLLQRGDLLAIRSAGAYGEIMASEYNCRPRAAAFFSKKK